MNCNVCLAIVSCVTASLENLEREFDTVRELTISQEVSQKTFGWENWLLLTSRLGLRQC